MTETSSAGAYRIVLVGNYPPDAQESMQRFSNVMLEGLRAAGWNVDLLLPPIFFGRGSNVTTHGLGKWLGYLDKYLLFPLVLRFTVAKHRLLLEKGAAPRRLLVHLCDHSNAMYGAFAGGAPVITTCHDLLAVRGALGEETDCPASPAGRLLQRWILWGLLRSTVIACVSSATMSDVVRLLPSAAVRVCLVPMGLNHSYKVRSAPEVAQALSSLPLEGRPYVLHVGSNLRRKNREGVLRIFAKSSARWKGMLVLAGQTLTPELNKLAINLGIESRMIEVIKPSNNLLEALYNGATAMLFPSRFEGFGWPIIEAQACGCPVLCSTAPPLPEVVGESALIRALEDEDGFANDLLLLTDSAERKTWSDRGCVNVQRFTTQRMIKEYLQIYRGIPERI